ncbi:MAG: molybdenum cofactor guanylyltransferase [Candidatus Neomarinimicrobiota bacterium]
MVIYASAFILVGGKSERFGSPKWKAGFEGTTLLGRAWDLLDPLFKETNCVTKRIGESTGKPSIYDSLPIASPFSGVHTALAATSTEWNFILSCDLPLVDETVIRDLWSAVSKDYQIIVPEAGRGMEPTCAFYHRSLVPTCRKMIKEKDYALYSLISRSKSRRLDFLNRDELFININTPEDLERAKRRASL